VYNSTIAKPVVSFVLPAHPEDAKEAKANNASTILKFIAFKSSDQKK
jgi:hypothetical protein